MQEFTDKAYNQMVESMSKPRVSHDMGGMVDPLDEPVGRGATKADWEAWKTSQGIVTTPLIEMGRGVVWKDGQLHTEQQNYMSEIKCSPEETQKLKEALENREMLPCHDHIPFNPYFMGDGIIEPGQMSQPLIFAIPTKPLAAKKLDPRAHLPTRAYSSNGYDLTALEGCEVKYGEVAQIRTGLAFDLSGYLMHILPKSGLAVKYGIHTMAGVIDSTYIGEVIVCLTKLTPGTHVFRDGDKIAQFILIRTENPEIQEVQELPSTERGSNGFGSSGT